MWLNLLVPCSVSVRLGEGSQAVTVVQMLKLVSGSDYGQTLLPFSCFDIDESMKSSPEQRFSTGGLPAKSWSGGCGVLIR